MATLGVILVSRFFEEFRRADPPPFDTVGFGLSGVSLGCLLFGLEIITRSDQVWQGLGLLAIGLVSGGLYIRYARRSAHPILDLSLLRITTFRLSVIAGSLTRITQGAAPFLLPLMLQVGFGVSAAVSGSITLAVAAGSFTMKWLAPRLLKRFGFRNVLVVNGLAGTLGYAVCSTFRPGLPMAVIFGVLMACGFAMSLQFTAYNTIAYDEMPTERMSAATSFYTTFQQLMLSLGICIGAGALHLGTVAAHRSAPGFMQFTVAFLLVTAISALATIWHLRFAPTAGDELSGRNPPERSAQASASASAGSRTQ
jgi:Na+/melibiose symporter-like transporter